MPVNLGARLSVEREAHSAMPRYSGRYKSQSRSWSGFRDEMQALMKSESKVIELPKEAR